MSNYSSSSSDKVSYEMIIAKSKSKIQLLSVETKDSKSEVSSKGVKTAYPYFQPDTQKDLSDKEMSIALAKVMKPDRSHPKLKMVNVLQPVVALKIPGGTQTTWKMTLPNMRHRPDTLFYDKLMNSKLSRYASPTVKLYRSNGTKQGLLNRLTEKLIGPAPKSSVNIKNLKFKDVHKYEKDLTSSSETLQSLNLNATPGLPYIFYLNKGVLPKITDFTYLPVDYHTTGSERTELLSTPIPILEHALNVARKMLNDIIRESSSFGEIKLLSDEFFKTHPELNTFILKRKDEKMERSEFYTKVRPYGAQALPTRLLSMWCVKPLEDNLANFMENPDSISAYHYSPFYGGSDRLIEYFSVKASKNIRFSGLAYGDDQLWMVMLKDGTMVMMGPDVSAMDMSTGSSCIADIVRTLVQNTNIPLFNARALSFSLNIAFKHDIHVGGPYIFSKTNSLISGIPGTTLINIFNSARIQTIIGETFESVSELTQDNFFQTLSKALELVKAQLGYVFKGFENFAFESAQLDSKDRFTNLMNKYADIMYTANPNDLKKDGIKLPFLSLKIVPITLDETRLVSVPGDMDKLGGALILPSSFSTKSTERAIKSLERIAGIYVSGGWIDPEYAEFLQENYKSLAKGLKFEPSFSEISTLGDKDVMEILKYMKRPELPSRKFMFDINTLSRDRFAELYSVPDAAYHDDFSKRVRSSNKDNGVTLDSDDLSELDSLNFDGDRKVDVKKMNNSNANTISKDKFKLDRLEKLKRLRESQKSFVNSVKGKTSRSNFASSFQGIAEAESRSEFEERMGRFEELYSEYVEEYSDGEETMAEYKRELQDRATSYYSTWDGYEQYEEDEVVEEEENEDDLDEMYAKSQYGKMTEGGRDA